jgi:hypothetical protein
MHRFLLLVIAGVIASGAAFADDPSHHGTFHLHGTYAFTGTSACLQDPPRSDSIRTSRRGDRPSSTNTP